MNISNHDRSNDWARVPSHLLDTIFDKLKLTKDYLQSGLVCQTWHSILKNNQIKRITSLPIDKHIPMLLIPDATNTDDNILRLFDITNSRLLDMKLVVPYNKRFCGFSRGWLAAVNENWSITLYKPFSTECRSISLPCLLPPNPEELFPCYDYFIERVLITTDPLTNPDECVIVVTSGNLFGIAFTHLTKDSTWTLIKKIDDFGDIYFSDFMHHGDHLFTVSDSGEIYSLNLKDPHNSILNLLMPEDGVHPATVKRYIVNPDDGNAIVVRRYFVESNETYLRKTHDFELFLVDIDRRMQSPESLNDIGDNSIFLGDNYSICVKASNFNGCRPNCIYFTNDLNNDISVLDVEEMILDIGVYDIKTKKFEFHFNMNSTLLHAMKSRPPIWIVPTLNPY